VVRERLAISKRATKKKIDIEIFHRRKINDVEAKEQYQVKISKRFTVLENLDNYVIMNIAWETTMY
jgi:hypothetical protein